MIMFSREPFLEIKTIHGKS